MGRVNTVGYNLLSKMKQAGLHDIFFGIESGNDEILKKAKKGITTKLVRRAVLACNDLTSELTEHLSSAFRMIQGRQSNRP